MKKASSLPPHRTLADCKTDAERIAFLKHRVEELESAMETYEQDGMYSTYFAQNRKVNEIAKSLNSFTLSLTEDDKTFERFMAYQKGQPAVIKNLNSLRSDYLKMDESALDKIAENGVPLIERRAQMNGSSSETGKKTKKAR